MFKHLTNLKYKRKGWEPLGFYLAYLLLVLLVTAIAGGIVGSFNRPDTFWAGVRVGTIVAVVFCLTLSYLVASAKKLTKGYGNLVLILLSGILAMWGGGLLGLIIPAYFTSKK